MISFIVIGKNEGFRLTMCLDSIYCSIQKNSISDYEVIYVDSKSTDDSLERVKHYPEVKVFSITGECNAAIARNIGGCEAMGDILVFLDGDMELQSDFISYAFTEEHRLIYPFISGRTVDYNYDTNWDIQNITNRHKLKENIYSNVTGGFFVVERKLWLKFHGMDVRLTRNQDLDFGLRLAKAHCPLLMLKYDGVHHHTIPYANPTRMKKLRSYGWCSGLLIRKHLLNRQFTNILFRSHYTSIILLILLILFPFFPFLLCIYPCCILVRSLKSGQKYIFQKLTYFVIRDFLVVSGALFYYPASEKIRYERRNK